MSGKALEGAAEVCAHFRKVLDGYRLYSKGHATLSGFIEVLHQKILAQAASGEDFVLGISALELTFQGKPVLVAAKREDSISHPLALDGIQKLTFCPGVSLAEVEQLMRIWRASLDGDGKAGQTFSTRFWETDFGQIRVVSVETFIEGSSASGEDEANKQVDNLKAVMSEIAGERMAGGSAGKSAAPKLLRITREDLQLLKLDGIADLTAADLARQDQAKRPPLSGLSEDEGLSLSTELATSQQHALERAIDALTGVAFFGTQDEVQQLRDLFRQLLQQMIASKHLAQVQAVLGRMVRSARADPGQVEERCRLLAQMMVALSSPDLLVPLIGCLDSSETAEGAVGVLRFVPGNSTAILVDMLQVPKTPEARRRLASTIADARPPLDELASRVAVVSVEAAVEILFIAQASSFERSWGVRLAALQHESVEVRRTALRGLTREQLNVVRAQLYEAAADSDPSIRRLLLNVFLSAKDRNAVPALLGLLQGPKPLEGPERKAVVVALGQLGGEKAIGALRREFADQGDSDLRGAAALALAAAGDEPSRPSLKAVAGKFFGSGPLKQACTEALRILDLRKPPSME